MLVATRSLCFQKRQDLGFDDVPRFAFLWVEPMAFEPTIKFRLLSVGERRIVGRDALRLVAKVRPGVI